MPTHWSAGRLLCALVVPLVLAGAAAGAGPAAAASAAGCQAITGVPPPSPGTFRNALNGVAVLSRCNAWAVGSFASNNDAVQHTLTEHWDGTAWTVVPSPSPGDRDNTLTSVSAASPTDVWAVGSFSDAGVDQALTEHWDGHAWSVFTSPSPGSIDNSLAGVRAISASNAWAVGNFSNGAGRQTLLLHFNGAAWSVVPSLSPGGTTGDSVLTAVAATSARDVWAVGSFDTAATEARTLILHFNGTTWKKVPSPNSGGTAVANALTGVAATATGDAWTVGVLEGGTTQTLILHWNGTAWRRVTSPDPGGAASLNVLRGVAATSTRDALAVGETGPHANQTLILHWDGTAWAVVPSPSPGGPEGQSLLTAVAATSASNAWIVGSFSGPQPEQVLALHCC